ncbi:unnamed protein product [Rhizopus stolonifer]
MPETINNYNPEKEPIKAYLRLRPGTGNQEMKPYIEVLDESMISMIPPSDSNAYRSRNKTPEKYKFTKIFKDTTDQYTFFNETTLNSVRDVLSGNNALVFAYGVTNSGKTYSVIGKDQDPGLIPRSIDLIFNSIKTHQSETKLKPSMHSLVTSYEDIEEENRNLLNLCNTHKHTTINQTIDIDTSFEYGIWISFIEIYNEQIFDLLDPAKPKPGTKRNQLQLKYEQRTSSRYVSDAFQVKVRSASEAAALLRFGQQNRQVFSTTMNQESSRSHSIFTIHVLKCPVDQDNFVIEDAQYATLSKLSIVDLAGSERHRNTLSTGQRLKEAGNINKSLMVLGQCMEVLRSNQTRNELSKNPAIIPYRQSKLTEIFKTSFEGNGKATIIVNVNPFDTGFDENNHVMKFSAIAKDVTTLKQVKPVVDLKNIKTGYKRLREIPTRDLEEEEEDIVKLNQERLFVEDLICQLESIEKRQQQVQDIELCIRQQVDQQVRNRLLDFALEEKQVIEQKMENENTDEKAKMFLNSLLEKQTAILKELNALKLKAEEAEKEKENLLHKIDQLQKEKNLGESLETEQGNKEDAESLEGYEESVSTESTPYDLFLHLRKELRRSIFKKDVLCEDTDSIMQQIEEFDGVTFNLAKETKMGKLLKVIASEKFENDPFQIQSRAFRLFKKYAQLAASNDHNKESFTQSTPPSPLLFPATLGETSFEHGNKLVELEEENFKLRRQIKSIHESHVKLKQVVEKIIVKEPRYQELTTGDGEDVKDTVSLVEDFPNILRLDHGDDDDDIGSDIFKQDKPLTKRRKLRAR